MNAVLMDWPYFGLAMVPVLFAGLMLEPRDAGAPSRFRDPLFVLPLLWPMYLLHQFEEHGIDLLGRRYAFLPEICSVLGFGDKLASCPADAAFIFAVNVAGCWMTFAMPFIFRRRAPLIAACAWGVPLVNAMTHIGAGIAHRAYNPGLLTSIVLFLPLTFWMVRVMLASGGLVRGQLVRVFLCGVAVHVVLIGSLLAREHGLPRFALLAINVVNGMMPIPFGLLGAARPIATHHA